MKRIAIIAGLIVCLGTTAVLSLPFILSTDLVRGQILSQLTSLTGSKVNFRGNPSVSFSPFLGIELSDFSIADPHSQDGLGMLLRVEIVKANLDLFPALIGNIKISEYQLVRPKLQLIQRSDGKSSWNFTSGKLHDALAAPQESAEASPKRPEIQANLGRFNILDGTISFQDSSSDRMQKIASISGSVVWPDTQSDMSLNVDAVWRNEAVKLSLDIDNAIQIFAGGESDITGNLQSAPLNLTLTGRANMLSDLFVEGDVEAETPSINRLTDFLNTGISDLRVIGGWRASGKLNATLETTLLSDAKLEINDNVANGVVRIANVTSETPKIDGTLAFDQIELADYLTQDEGHPDPIDTVTPTNVDIDLRISANSIDTGRFTLQNVAAAITSSESGWKFDIGNAEAFGGTLVAQLSSEIAEIGPQLSLKFNTRASDAAALESLTGEQDWSIEGNIDLKGDLRTQLHSTTLPDLQFNGELEVSAKDGIIDGINLNEVFNGIQQGRTGVVSEEDSQGDTEYESLDLKVFLSNNIASISKASIQTPESQIQFLGDADLSKGTLAVRAQRIDADGPIPGRLIIGGTLNDPLVTIRSIPEPTDVHPQKLEQQPTNETEENSVKEKAG